MKYNGTFVDYFFCSRRNKNICFLKHEALSFVCLSTLTMHEKKQCKLMQFLI